MMPLKLHIISIIGGVALMCIIIHLVRKEKLSLRYALLWIITIPGIIIISAYPPALLYIAHFLGINLAVNALFFLSIFFIILFLLEVTVAISKNAENNNKLAREIAILKENMEKIKKELENRG